MTSLPPTTSVAMSGRRFSSPVTVSLSSGPVARSSFTVPSTWISSKSVTSRVSVFATPLPCSPLPTLPDRRHAEAPRNSTQAAIRRCVEIMAAAIARRSTPRETADDVRPSRHDGCSREGDPAAACPAARNGAPRGGGARRARGRARGTGTGRNEARGVALRGWNVRVHLAERRRIRRLEARGSARRLGPGGRQRDQQRTRHVQRGIGRRDVGRQAERGARARVGAAGVSRERALVVRAVGRRRIGL